MEKRIIKPEFEVGQKVWRIDSNKVVEQVITTVRLANGDIWYYGFQFADRWKEVYASVGESDLFSTREELIKSL